VDKKNAFTAFQIVEAFAPGVRRCSPSPKQQMFQFSNDFGGIPAHIVNARQMFQSEEHSTSHQMGIIFRKGASVSCSARKLSTEISCSESIHLNHRIFTFVEKSELALGCEKSELWKTSLWFL
jgi:hypothetical protein